VQLHGEVICSAFFALLVKMGELRSFIMCNIQ